MFTIGQKILFTENAAVNPHRKGFYGGLCTCGCGNVRIDFINEDGERLDTYVSAKGGFFIADNQFSGHPLTNIFKDLPAQSLEKEIDEIDFNIGQIVKEINSTISPTYVCNNDWSPYNS